MSSKPPPLSTWLDDLTIAFRAWRTARRERLIRKYQRQEWIRTAHLAPRRPSIFPHFDVDRPMPRRATKPRIRVPYRREPEVQIVDHLGSAARCTAA